MFLLRTLIRTLFVLLLLNNAIFAEEQKSRPEAVINDTTKKFIAILSQSDLTEDTKRFKCNFILQPLIAIEEFSQVVLDKYWENMGEADKVAVQNSFRIITFNDHWLELRKYTNEQVKFVSSKTEQENLAVVDSVILGQDGQTEIPFSYKMRFDGEQWMIIDIEINGRSMASKYQEKYASLLEEKGVRGLLKQMKKEMRGYKKIIKELQKEG